MPDNNGENLPSVPPLTRAKERFQLAQQVALASQAQCNGGEAHGTAVTNPREHEAQGTTGNKVVLVTVTGTLAYFGHLDVEVPSDATYEDLDAIFHEIVCKFGAPRNILSDCPREEDDLKVDDLEVDEMITLDPTSQPQYQASRAGNGRWVVK